MTTTTISEKTYSKRAVLSTNDANSIVLFRCDGCSETSKYLKSFTSSSGADTSYLCDVCLHK